MGDVPVRRPQATPTPGTARGKRALREAGPPATSRAVPTVPRQRLGKRALQGENAKSARSAGLDHANEGVIVSLASRGDSVLIVSEENAVDTGVHVSL